MEAADSLGRGVSKNRRSFAGDCLRRGADDTFGSVSNVTRRCTFVRNVRKY
jgi:hypothetical protein